KRYADDMYVVNKLSRWYSMSGNATAAASSIERLTVQATESEYAELLLAEIRVRHGEPADVLAATEVLRSLRDAADLEAKLRAGIELARLASELDGEPDKAIGLLQPVLALGEEYGLIFARLAEGHLAAGRRARAVALATVACDDWGWASEPR